MPRCERVEWEFKTHEDTCNHFFLSARTHQAYLTCLPLARSLLVARHKVPPGRMYLASRGASRIAHATIYSRHVFDVLYGLSRFLHTVRQLALRWKSLRDTTERTCRGMEIVSSICFIAHFKLFIYRKRTQFSSY